MAMKCKFIRLMDQDTIFNRFKLMLAEFLSTYILVILGCMSCVDILIPPPFLVESVALGFGLAVTIAVTCFGHISGAHLNPAVSLASVLLGYLPMINLPIYWTGQILGSCAAYGSLMLFTGDMQPNSTKAPFCVNHVNKDLHDMQGFGVELITTMFLVLTACGVWDYRNRDKFDSVPIKFGLIVAGLALSAVPYSSGSMNPARSLGPALLSGDFDQLWIFIFAPFAGGIIAALMYRIFFTYKIPEDEEQK